MIFKIIKEMVIRETTTIQIPKQLIQGDSNQNRLIREHKPFEIRKFPSNPLELHKRFKECKYCGKKKHESDMISTFKSHDPRVPLELEWECKKCD